MEEPRKRYYVAWGGRGSGKSWSFARALLVQAMKEPLRILCVREIQRTISDSVHRLLADQIAELGMDWFYTIQETSISGLNGCEFLFTGLRGIDAAKIKSFEGVDIAWCEEAQALSKRSWNTLIPTIRAPGSEIWATFNPDMDSDDTYQRFVVNQPESAFVANVNWQDNPWFPDALDGDRRSMLRSDPVEYENVWEGKCKTVIAGAIYANEVRQLIEDHRMRLLPYDPILKVHTVWDLGWNDQSSIILVQRGVSEVRIIDYIEDSQQTLAEYVTRLNQRRFSWGYDWLPHDGESHSVQTGKSPKEIIKALGRNVRIIPKLDVESGIKAARMMFPRVYMDEKCSRLLDCLKRYRRAVPEATGEPGRPVHDEYSHGADAFRGLGVVVEKLTNEEIRKPTVTPYIPAVRGVM